PLFWFLLLGPFGVAAYRLLAQAVQGPQAARLSGASHEGGSRALAVLEWPVAQLMALSMALVGNFDTVFSAWRRAAGNRWALELDFLGEAARAGVGMELGEEAEEAREAGLVPIDERFPELRDAMSVVWRMLLLWMAVLALMIIAGWVGCSLRCGASPASAMKRRFQPGASGVNGYQGMLRAIRTMQAGRCRFVRRATAHGEVAAQTRLFSPAPAG